MGYNLKSIKKQFAENGVFYTPPELAELLKSYIKFKPKTVYDPTCGDGSLLSVFDDDVAKYGQEINGEQLEVAKNRLVNFTGFCGDTLTSPAFGDMKFSCIIANPPFSIKWQPFEDERFSTSPVLPPPSKADYAFILHILHYLTNDGIAVTLNFPGILYRGQKEGKIRQWLVEENYIERVCHIPCNTFVDTKIATALVVFRKNKDTTDVIFEDRQTGKERVVTFEEIKDNDFNLCVNTYIQEEVPKKIVDPIKLNNEARDAMYKRLINDIKVDLMVCEFENINQEEYLDKLMEIIKEFKKGV